MPLANMHASALIAGDRGLLVAGPSASGKTALCLALLRHCAAAGVFARLVSDDQVYLQRAGGRLVARAPEPIAGLVEVAGYRPSAVAHETAMVADLLLRLVPGDEAPRYGEGEAEILEQCSIASLRLPAGNAAAGVSAVCAWLGLPPFDGARATQTAISGKNDLDAGK